MGRSSTRHGSAAVFGGTVRRWNKKWVPLSTADDNGDAVNRHPEEPPCRKFRYVLDQLRYQLLGFLWKRQGDGGIVFSL
ncbi:unnamed protein product [Musa hybrid cultivar]